MGQGVCSYHLAHEITHGLRRLVLHLACGVGVGAQGEARVIVAQHTGGKRDRGQAGSPAVHHLFRITAGAGRKPPAKPAVAL